MRLGLLLRYRGNDTGPRMELVEEAERLGYDPYGRARPTAPTPSRRSPGCSRARPASRAAPASCRFRAHARLRRHDGDVLAGDVEGSFPDGIGPSGPQVIEGWHGEPYGKPLARTKEYIEIIRRIFDRAEPLQYRGGAYRSPTRVRERPAWANLSRAFISRPGHHIYTAAFAPAGLRTAGEIADGMLPIFMSPGKNRYRRRPRAGRDCIIWQAPVTRHFDIALFVRVAMGPDLQKRRDTQAGTGALHRRHGRTDEELL